MEEQREEYEAKQTVRQRKLSLQEEEVSGKERKKQVEVEGTKCRYAGYPEHPSKSKIKGRMGRSLYCHVMVDIGGRQSPLSTVRGASFIPSSCDNIYQALPVFPLFPPSHSFTCVCM